MSHEIPRYKTFGLKCKKSPAIEKIPRYRTCVPKYVFQMTEKLRSENHVTVIYTFLITTFLDLTCQRTLVSIETTRV